MMVIVRANLRKIGAHNEREERGLETWRMAVTQFADLTEEVFFMQSSNLLKFSDLTEEVFFMQFSNLLKFSDLTEEVFYICDFPIY